MLLPLTSGPSYAGIIPIMGPSVLMGPTRVRLRSYHYDLGAAHSIVCMHVLHLAVVTVRAPAKAKHASSHHKGRCVHEEMRVSPLSHSPKGNRPSWFGHILSSSAPHLIHAVVSWAVSFKRHNFLALALFGHVLSRDIHIRPHLTFTWKDGAVV